MTGFPYRLFGRQQTARQALVRSGRFTLGAGCFPLIVGVLGAPCAADPDLRRLSLAGPALPADRNAADVGSAEARRDRPDYFLGPRLKTIRSHPRPTLAPFLPLARWGTLERRPGRARHTRHETFSRSFHRDHVAVMAGVLGARCSPPLYRACATEFPA